MFQSRLSPIHPFHARKGDVDNAYYSLPSLPSHHLVYVRPLPLLLCQLPPVPPPPSPIPRMSTPFCLNDVSISPESPPPFPPTPLAPDATPIRCFNLA